MALFSFGRKKEEPVPAAVPAGTPTELVIQMRQQGLTNNQIVQTLQRQGYSSSQIFDAMSQSDIKRMVERAPPPVGVPPQPVMQQQLQQGPPQMPAQSPPVMPPPLPMPSPAPGAPRERIEEIAEAIIDEKWEELMKNVEKIISWKEETETKITKIEQSITDMKKSFGQLQNSILGKISDYDKGIRNVGTDIKAMQEVFKKVLPKFTENIATLERITKKVKKK